MDIKKLLEIVWKAKQLTEEVFTLKFLTDIEVELEKESNLVEAPVMLNFAEEIDKMLKNIEEYFDAPNYKNNVVAYKSYYDGAYHYLKELKTILKMKSKISA